MCGGGKEGGREGGREGGVVGMRDGSIGSNGGNLRRSYPPIIVARKEKGLWLGGGWGGWCSG